MRKPLNFLILFFLTINLASPQEIILLNPSKRLTQYPLKAWDMDSGIPSDMIIGMLQDTLGYLWFATYKGVVRFDGVKHSVFNQSSSKAIESINIQSITKDKEGNLWVGSLKGVVLYTNYSFHRDSGLAELNNKSIEALYFDYNSNHLWIGTTNNGVYRYDFNKLEHLPNFLKLSQSVVNTIGGDINGNIWIGTEGGDIIKYNGASFLKIESSNKMGGIGSFYYSTLNNVLWVAAENGIYKLVNDTLTFENNIPIDRANVIVEDIHKTLWVGTDNGLYRYHIDKEFTEKLDESKGIPNNIIKDLFVDNEGNLWVATYRKGFFKLTDGLIKTYSETEGLSSNIITGIAQLDLDKFFIADENGTINILENDSISQLPLASDIKDSRLKHLLVDSKDNLWISTYRGLVIRKPNGKEIHLRYPANFPTETVRLTFEDSNGDYWVGSRSNGIIRLNSYGEIREIYNRTNGLSSNYIMAIVEDMLGRILVGTKNGINIIENNRVVKVLNMETGLPSNFVFNIHVDNNNIFWVSSNDGIYRIENDRNVFVFNMQNGLFDNAVFDILEDNSENFWIPSDYGIAQLSKDELNRFAKGEINKYTYRLLGKNDGMQDSRCIGATKSLKAIDGRMFFTTNGGVSIISPSDYSIESTTSKPIIERLVSNGISTKPSHSFTINPRVNRIQIHYTAFNYKESENLQFRYKLSPFDNQWVDANTQREAQYTNLPPGNYTFKVQATNRVGFWDDSISEVKLQVERNWWQTWWFIIAISLLFSVIILSLYKTRNYAIKRRQLELERLVRVRTTLIAQQKIEIEAQSKELEKLSIVASHTNNAVMLTSPKGIITWVNDSFARIYGYTLEEFIAEKGSNLAKVSSDTNIQYIIKKCIDEHEPVNYSIEVQSKDGKNIWIQTNLTPIKDDKGNVRQIVAIDSDISPIKQAEAEMISMNDEIIAQAEAILQQNEEIQSQRDELEQINNLLIKHTQKIESSIWYAHTIQKAILPTQKSISQHFDNFIVFKPRDIVSGDFYWFHQISPKNTNNHEVVVAVVDCTGHGVPGALMSMIGSRLLSEIVAEQNITNPAIILKQLNRLVNVVLKQDSEDSIDGMDIALCNIKFVDEDNFDIIFSGANRPLYILKKNTNKVDVVKGSKKTIGGIMPDVDAEFTNKQITVSKGDMIIMNSDGYIDQNREDGKKFSVYKLHNLLTENSQKTMQEIGECLDIAFDEYRGLQPQRDDATVLGIRF